MTGVARSVLVIVGTDHHPFDRVVQWTDAWLARQPEPLDAVVQHGTSAPPTRAQGHSLIAPDRLHGLIQEATVVVTHGGPATIAEVRRLGHLPVVVPRDPERGEHVDGHQQRFCRKMAERGWLMLCETQDQLTAALDSAVGDPSRFLLAGSEDHDRVAASVDAVARILDELVGASGPANRPAGGRARAARWPRAARPVRGWVPAQAGSLDDEGAAL